MESSTTALIIIGVMMVLYITELLPIATTSLLACLALAVFGVIRFSDAFSGFGNDIVFLITGMIVVGDALFETGVAGLISKKIISIVGANERAFLGALIVVMIPFSAFLSNTATAAMILPIAASSVAASGGRFKKKNTFMAVGMISVAGGGLTLVSSTPQLIAQGLLKEGGYGEIGFFEIALTGAPVFVLLALYALTVGYWMTNKVFDLQESADSSAALSSAGSDTAATESVDTQKKSRKEVARMCISIAVLVFCVTGFISGLWTTGLVAMAGAVICVVTGCITQEKVFNKMNWTTVVIMGCSFGFAAGLEQSGAGRLIAHGMIDLLGDNLSPWLLCATLALAAVILTNFMSSTATAALLVPIAALVALELGYDVKSIVLSVAIAANIGYATPISTPPITMTLAAGYKFMDYVKYGGLFNILAYLLVVLLFPLVLNFR